jgi:phosphatidate cytidylyltransferase
LTPDQTPAPADTPKPGPSNLQLRTIYGLLGAALLVGSVWFSSWTFGLFFAFVQAVMLWEFYRMMRAGGYAPATWLGIGASLFVFVTVWFLSTQELGGQYGNVFFAGDSMTVYPPLGGPQSEPSPMENLWLLVRDLMKYGWLVAGGLFTVIILLREILRWPNSGNPFINLAITVAGLFYIGLPMSLLGIISTGAEGYDYRRVIVLLFLIWSSDIGAYAAGKTFGKHKLAPKISPGKTWEGFAGGVILTLAMGWALGYLIPELPLAHRLVAAGVVAVFGPLGDLAESMLKRSVGVKDSGSIMPGHGGLLDRFDAFLLVLPVLVLLQLLAG